MLQMSYAIEVGAYNAYEGHWRSLKLPQERGQIQAIQLEEQEHQETLERMLKELGAKPCKFFNAIFWVIGKTISVGCRVMSYRMAMWGAGIMEILGGYNYHMVAQEALKEGYTWMSGELGQMQAAEEAHERFFKEKLE